MPEHAYTVPMVVPEAYTIQGTPGDPADWPCYFSVPCLTCAELGLEDGTQPGTCVSLLDGSDIPLRIAVVVTGSYTENAGCGGGCDDAVWGRNNNAGVTLGCLVSSVAASEDYENYSTLGGDSWAGLQGGLTRSYNSKCNGGEYFLASGWHWDGFGRLDSSPLWYQAFDNPPDMLQPQLVTSHWPDAYYYMNADQDPTFPCGGSWPPYNPCQGTWPYLGPTFTGLCEWHPLCWNDNDGLVHGVYCDGGTLYSRDGYGTCATRNPPQQVENDLHAIIHPASLLDYYCCDHGPYCITTNVAQYDPAAKGVCCVEITFAGLSNLETYKCFIGRMENYKEPDEITVRYQHVNASTWQCAHWGCLGPWPTILTIIASVAQNPVTGCYETTYTATLTGSDTILNEAGAPTTRTVTFRGIKTVEKNNGWNGILWLPRQLAQEDFDGFRMDFVPGESANLDIDKSLDFSTATATLTMTNLSYENCADTEAACSFFDVDSWQLKFTPAENRLLYYNELYYDCPGGNMVGPFQFLSLPDEPFYIPRVIAPIVDNSTWLMNDSTGCPTFTDLVAFTFDATPDDPPGLGVVGIEETDEQQYRELVRAINERHAFNPDTFKIQAWFDETPADPDSETSIAKLIEEIYDTNYQPTYPPGEEDVFIWTPELGDNRIFLTTRIQGFDTPTGILLFAAGTMAIRLPWYHGVGSGDWATVDPVTGEVTVTMDQMTRPGQTWMNGSFPIGVTIDRDEAWPNACTVRLLFEFAGGDDLRYSFCVPAGYQPAQLSCLIDDAAQRFGYADASNFTLIPHYRPES